MKKIIARVAGGHPSVIPHLRRLPGVNVSYGSPLVQGRRTTWNVRAHVMSRDGVSAITCGVQPIHTRGLSDVAADWACLSRENRGNPHLVPQSFPRRGPMPQSMDVLVAALVSKAWQTWAATLPC